MERYIFVKSYYLFNVIARGPELENSPGRKWVTQQRVTGCKVLTSASFFLSWAQSWEQDSAPKNSLRVSALKCIAALGLLSKNTDLAKHNPTSCDFWHLCDPSLLHSCSPVKQSQLSRLVGTWQWIITKLCWFSYIFISSNPQRASVFGVWYSNGRVVPPSACQC